MLYLKKKMKKPKGQIVAIFIQTTVQQCAIKSERLEQSRHAVTPKLSISAAINFSAKKHSASSSSRTTGLGTCLVPHALQAKKEQRDERKIKCSHGLFGRKIREIFQKIQPAA